MHCVGLLEGKSERRLDVTEASGIMESMNSSSPRFCVIVPAYQEGTRIGRVVTEIRKYSASILVIDDGSADDTEKAAREAGAEVIRHPQNRGKGAALNTAFTVAIERGYDFVITMDADGQHAPEDIPAFVGAFKAGAGDVIIGNRMDRAQNMPRGRKMTNAFMSWLLSCEMKQRVPDTQCGYRLFGAKALPFARTESQRFAAESEVLLDMSARGIRFGAAPIKVIYGDEKSKIRPFRDAMRFFRMLLRHRMKAAGHRSAVTGH
jgi:glycosyltransferase involved in cell wall biosynthesis